MVLPKFYAKIQGEVRNTPRAITSGFADYSRFDDDQVCCGWLELHRDYNFSLQVVTFKPTYVHCHAVLLHKSSRRYELTELKVGELVTFKPTELHGLVPRSLAKKVVERNSSNFPEYKEWERRISHKANRVKLVWNWVNT